MLKAITQNNSLLFQKLFLQQNFGTLVKITEIVGTNFCQTYQFGQFAPVTVKILEGTLIKSMVFFYYWCGICNAAAL